MWKIATVAGKWQVVEIGILWHVAPERSVCGKGEERAMVVPLVVLTEKSGGTAASMAVALQLADEFVAAHERGGKEMWSEL